MTRKKIDDTAFFGVSNSSSDFQKEHPCLHRGRSALKQFDLFAFTPAPRFFKEKQVSLRGLIGSVVALVLLFAYMGVSLERFLSGAPSVSQVQQPPDADPTDFVPIGVVFRINDAQLVPKIVFYNESYFKMVASITIVTEQDRYPRTVIQVPMKPCDISSWAGWLGATAMCPETPLQVQGRYQSNNYTFGRVDIVACDPAAPYTSDDGSGRIVQCAPTSDINQLISDGRFNLLQLFDAKMPGVPPSWEAHMYLINPSMWSLYEQSYAIRLISVNAEYLRTWIDKTYTTMEMVTEKFFSRAPAMTSSGGRYMLTIYMRLGSFNVEESQQMQTSMDLAGQLWAFFGLILTVFGLYFMSYNEKKFFEANPGWDEIDAQFRSKYAREQEECSPANFTSTR
ncbi:transmembrane protein, putative [Bodo saltans]|uniref:Transmembrane protein, putative n=1 Tax=Bodo saltans TaxID=75058 RepID=A0A0S4IQ28_BODSA|nr:transmembrane protein, putative [Bodo saltans]|eukprot:CUE58088.1 transmembrane protein, putative [Bodo saltans]